MRVFIAEKPDLGKVIAEALGNGQRKGGYIQCGQDIVTWCIGHLLELAPPEAHNPAYEQWVAEDLPLKLRPVKLQPIAGTRDQLKIVGELIGQATEIVHAGDPDDEGQLLVDEVLEYFGNTSPVKRALINDININTARKALDNLQDNRDFYGLYQKALARSIGDQLYGFNMTRAYTLAGQARGVRGVLVVGRVVTVILGLVVVRFNAYTRHSAAYFYGVSAALEFKGTSLNGRFQVPEGAPVDEKGRLIDEAFVKAIAQACQQQSAVLKSIEIEDKQTAAPLPFALLDLQAEMSEEYGLGLEKTLAITQSLRETHKAITYNRSNCNYLSNEQFSEAPKTLALLAQVFPDLAKTFAEVDPARKSRAFNDDKTTAHTGIIPTAIQVDLGRMSEDEKKVYFAIVKQYLAQFMPSKGYRSAKATFDVAGQTFVVRATKVTEPGWTALLKEKARNADGEGDAGQAGDSPFDVLEALAPDATGVCQSVKIAKEKTKPLPLYTEATLLKDLKSVAKYVTDPRIKQLLLDRDRDIDGEHGGIGTPATRGSMIEKLFERRYCTLEKNKVIPTKHGLDFYNALPAIATQPDMTALWHEQQQQIEAGELTVEAFLDELETFIARQIAAIDLGSLQGLNITTPCPMCGGELAPNSKTISCKACEFHIFRDICGKELTEEQVTQLLTTGKTGLIKGLKSSKAGSKAFDASLKLTAEGKVEFIFPKTKPPAKKRA